MIQREKYLPCKPENLSSFSRTLLRWKERTNQLVTLLYLTGVLWEACTYILYTHPNKLSYLQVIGYKWVNCLLYLSKDTYQCLTPVSDLVGSHVLPLRL